MADDEHPSRLLPPCPRRQPRAETDHHRLMSDFESLVAEASNGKYQQHPGGGGSQPVANGSSPTDESMPTSLSRNRSGGGASGFSGTPASNFESSFFRASNFSALLGAGRSAGTPNSRASSSASSALSEGRLGGCVPPSRLPPIPAHESPIGNEACQSEGTTAEASPPLAARAHRSLLGLLTSKLRRQQPLDVSPRPHSVPVDMADYERTTAGGESLVIGRSCDDETRHSVASLLSRSNTHASTRPATTGETDPRAQPSRPPRHDGPAGAGEVWVDNKSAVDKELEEIERLRAKRDEDRIRREQERLERRQKRSEKASEAMLPGAAEEGGATAAVLSPRSALQEERTALLELIKQDLSLQMETEAAARDALEDLQQQLFERTVRDAAFELDQISIAEEAQHQRKLRTIAERAQLEDKYREEREKQRRWEVVRDTVVDEEQHRQDLDQSEATRWQCMLDGFFAAMDAPCMGVVAEERLTRTEYWAAMEQEVFMDLERRYVCDLEALLRRRSERAWVSLAASAISVPLMLFHRSCRIVLEEATRRRQTLVAQTIEHGVLWERFCEDVHPLIDRALWKTQTAETDVRVLIEQACAEDGAAVYHGCKNSRELVTRYAAVVRDMNARRAQHREEALADILEDELAERILAQRDERESFILIEEMWRRGLDAIRINLKKRHIHDAMQAAEVLRQAEVQRALIEEERQQNARVLANRNRTVSTPSSDAPTARAGRKLSASSSTTTARPKPTLPKK